MEAVIFCGIQASGKSTFYKEHFFDTHVRISMDLLRTRHRERMLMAACLQTKQPFVVDNTNPTREDRARYVEPARAAGFRVVCYYFETDPRAAFARNRKRPGRANIPPAGLFGTAKRLVPPTLEEGFDRVEHVRLVDGQGFAITASS
jgi:predicted kinase